MKTLFFCNLVPRKQGSFEAFLTALGDEFSKGGNELVLALAADPIPQVATAFRQAGLRWHVIEDWITEQDEVNAWAFCSPAIRLLVDERPDVAVVHFGNELPSLAAYLAARFRGIKPKWVWQQDQQIGSPGAVTSRISKIRLLSTAFDRLVAVYEGGKQSMVLRGIPDGKIDVVNNSTNAYSSKRTVEQVRRDLGVSETAVVAVAVSSLIPRKRLDFIIRACSGVRVDDSGPVLLIVGDGPERVALESLVSELGIGGSVKFTGLRNDVREILAAGDLFVHSATAEACSYAIIESMAAGLPALVTDSGAAREQIEDGESGFVVDPNDSAGFKRRLEELFENADLRRKMGETARKRWYDSYRTEVSASKYYELYRSLADEK